MGIRSNSRSNSSNSKGSNDDYCGVEKAINYFFGGCLKVNGIIIIAIAIIVVLPSLLGASFVITNPSVLGFRVQKIIYGNTTLQQIIDERISFLKEQISHQNKPEINNTFQIQIDAIRSVQDMEKVGLIIE